MENSSISSDFKNLSEEDRDNAAPCFDRVVGPWTFESIGGFYLPTETISKLSVKRQEQLLIRDLIYAFSGVPSSHIRPDINIEQISKLRAENIEQVRFKIDENFSGAFRALASELLPMIGYYINVQTFIEDTILTTTCGRALGKALHRQIQEYFEVQSNLEKQMQEHKLNLYQLVRQLRPWLVTMEAYASVTSRVRRMDLNSAQLLSLMDEQLTRFKTDGLKRLITDVSSYYMKMVQLWTQKGVLYDVRGEFFIEDTSASAMSSTLLSPKQCCHAYWEQRYRLHMDRLPSFLELLAERILLAGKYLNVLRQCNVQMKLMQTPLIYLPQEEAHDQVICSSYELPARKLLQVLLEDDLKQHLRNLQGYFLLRDQEFVTALLQNGAILLQCDVESLKPEMLHKLLREALQLSNDPFKHMLCPHLMNCDVATQMANRLKRLKPEPALELNGSLSEVEASSEAESTNELQGELSLCGYEAFALLYKPSWPISLVIHDEPLEQVQLLQRVLFYLRYVQQQLSARNSQRHSSSCALNARMMNCMLQLEEHMINDIVKPRWHALFQALEKSQIVDELLTQFNSTLDQCLRLCLLSEPVTFVRSLYTLGQLCLNFCDYDREFLSQDECESSIIVEYEEQFNDLLEGILELIMELAKPNSACEADERDSSVQLLQRLERIKLQEDVHEI